MDFLCYHRDRCGSMALREELRERHWSYMDRYSGDMVARGPTLTADGDVATGSLHIVDLPDADAARTFAFDEPNHQAGVYRDVLLRRWQNRLGRTMWDAPDDARVGRRFLVLGYGEGAGADLEPPDAHGDLIAYGPLLSDAGDVWLGTAALIAAPDPHAAGALLTRDRYAEIEVHRWDFGGRR